MSELEQCQELIALLRRALLATAPAIRNGMNAVELESLLWDVASGEPFGDKQKEALDILERLAGYIADGDECYP